MDTTINSNCCALLHTKATELTSIDDLNARLKALRDGGYRATFIITRETEPLLVGRLKELEFKPVAEFPRRKEYDNTLLTMWFKVL